MPIKYHTFIGSIPNINETTAQEYVTDAVTSWCGGLRPPGAETYSETDPGDPIP